MSLSVPFVREQYPTAHLAKYKPVAEEVGVSYFKVLHE